MPLLSPEGRTPTSAPTTRGVPVGSRRLRALAVAVLPLVFVLAGCSGGGDDRHAAKVQAARAIGQGEGALSLLTWNGYAEGGGNDPRVDWVKPFEKKTDCKVDIRYAADPEEMLDLMSTPNYRYDGVSASPEIAGQLIADHQVVPINPDLVSDYSDLQPELRDQLVRKGRHYAVPFVWGSNLVMYDPKVVRPAPDGWAALFDPDQVKKYSGKVVMRDSPMTLGDAALYLRAHRPKLHIEDPFDLTDEQLAAAAEVLAEQHSAVKLYWLNSADAIDAFVARGAVLGEVWAYQFDVLERGGHRIAGITPKEGVTGWMNAWMVGARADHPNCMYKWLNWTTTPEVQWKVAKWNGVAPANPQACSHGRLKARFCAAHHVRDRSFLKKVIFAHTPMRNCKPDDDDCTDYADWAHAWRKARGESG